jgi:hypothetical protein
MPILLGMFWKASQIKVHEVHNNYNRYKYYLLSYWL